MTYSYARQSWVEAKIAQGVFGITFISRIADIPDATGKTWLRQATHRLPASKKMPREYERGMGILLLEKYPKCAEQIAKMVFTTPRMLRQWATEDRHHWQTSDLRQQTHAVAHYFRPLMDEYFGLSESGEIYLVKNQWPDSTLFEKEFHEILDLIAYFVIELEANYRYIKIASDLSWMGRGFPPELKALWLDVPVIGRESSVHVPMYGPHRYRYTTKNFLDSKRMNWEDALPYTPGGLSGVNVGDLYNPFESALEKLYKFMAHYGDDHKETQVLAEVIELKDFLAQRDQKLQEERRVRDEQVRVKKTQAS
jgi:hypothetical protein